MNLVLKGVLLCSFLSSSSLRAEAEKWTRSADGVKISAELVSFDPATNKVTLKLKTGAVAVIDGAILVEENQQRLTKYVEGQAAISEAAKLGRLESYDVNRGGGHKMHIYRPAGYIDGDDANASRPVALVYSPGGKSSEILNLLKAGADELGWIIVGVDAYSNDRLVAKEHAQVMEDTEAAYRDALKHVTFDKKKVVFGGFSGGGFWSYKSSSWLLDDTAGIIAIGGWMSNSHHNNYSKKMAVAIVNGLDDKGANDYIEPDTKCLEKDNRATIKLFTYPGGHTLPEHDIVQKAMRWIHETKKFGE